MQLSEPAVRCPGSHLMSLPELESDDPAVPPRWTPPDLVARFQRPGHVIGPGRRGMGVGEEREERGRGGKGRKEGREGEGEGEGRGGGGRRRGGEGGGGEGRGGRGEREGGGGGGGRVGPVEPDLGQGRPDDSNDRGGGGGEGGGGGRGGGGGERGGGRGEGGGGGKGRGGGGAKGERGWGNAAHIALRESQPSSEGWAAGSEDRECDSGDDGHAAVRTAAGDRVLCPPSHVTAVGITGDLHRADQFSGPSRIAEMPPVDAVDLPSCRHRGQLNTL